MNPNNYNMQSMYNSNVGFGWSTNYNTQNASAPMSHHSGPPPPIGFIIPNSNQGDYQNIHGSTYTGFHESNEISGKTNQNYHIQNLDHGVKSNPQDREGTSNFVYDDKNVAESKPQNSFSMTSDVGFHSGKIKKPDPPKDNQKSDYQKGLDQLAELMRDDIDVTPEVLNETRIKYDLKK